MKRIISVMISAALALSTVACASAEETERPQLAAENGKITVTNAVENGTLILAFYDNGVLAGANMYRGSDTIEADMSTAPENADKVKAFYWDMKNITPMGNVISLPLNDEPTESPDDVPTGTPTEEPTAEPTEEPTPAPTEDAEKENDIMVKIGNKDFAATLYDNETAEVFKEMLPLTLDMIELNGNEKYCNLPDTLPTSAERVGTINAGDIMLYGSDCVVLFYETFNTPYSYTRIGHIDDVTGLAGAVGSGNVIVTFE